ncbi:MAG TPA: hypothetical protein VGI82_08220 [Chitinophagaceae bacterium]|jgi:hypothetical protein
MTVKFGKDKANGSGVFSSQTNIEIEGQYLLENQWILLDIINHLNGREPNLPNDFIDELKNLNAFIEWGGEVFRFQNFK